MLGYSEAELQTLRIQELTPPQDREKEQRQIQRLLDGFEAPVIQKQALCKSGKIIWLDQGVSLIEQQLLFQCVEITENKLLEINLRQSEEKFSKAFFAAPSLIAISRISDGNIIDTNESFRRTLGYSSAEIIGNTVPNLKILYPEDYQELLQEIINQGALKNKETSFFTREGQHHCGLFSAERLRIREDDYMLLLINDITERKQAEEALFQSEEKFAKSFWASPIMMAIVDAETGHYQEVNNSFVQTIGYTREDVQGRNSVALGLVTPEQLAGFYKIFREKKVVHNFEVEYHTPKGETRYGLVSAEFFQVGAKRFILGMVNDVTEIRLAQQAQIESYQQTDRIKDEFLSVISHELRTPLNAVIGFGSLLQDETAGPLTPKQQLFVDRILKGGDRMLVLVDDLLDYARIQAGKFSITPEETNYPALIDETIASFMPSVEEKKLTLRQAIEVPQSVLIDRRRIQQVLANLINNAIKFTPREGEIRVHACINENQLITEVKDNGIGIAPNDIPKLFHPFEQLDMSLTRRAGGIGLGLSISKAIVNAHGGSIEVESEVGKGSTFRFYLPLEAT